MSKVVLFSPTYPDSPAATGMPMGILCIGASLRQSGYDVVLVDAQVHADWERRLAAEAEDAIYVGISAMTLQVRGGVSAAKIVRKLRRRVPIVWGGTHASIFPEQTVRSGLCDIAVIGEGDVTALELARCLERGETLSDIEGITYENSGAPATNPRCRAISNLDDLPNPATNLYSDYEIERFIAPKQTRPEKRNQRLFILHCGRGCRFQCTFCINTVLPETSRRHRSKSAARIVGEMETFGIRYAVNTFLLQDEDFFTDKRKVLEFLDLYEAEKLTCKWGAWARANYFHDDYINREFCERLASCGAVNLIVGVESGSERMLKRMKKDIAPDMARQTARAAAGTGLILSFGFMIGMPHEERKDVCDTIRLLWDIHHIAPRNHDFVGPAIYRPYPGSVMYEEAVEMGLKMPGSLNEWGNAGLTVWGYLGDEALPWIKNTDLNAYIREVFLFLLAAPDKGRFHPKQFLRMLLKAMAYFRIRTGFWRGLIELHTFRFMKGIMKKISGGASQPENTGRIAA